MRSTILLLVILVLRLTASSFAQCSSSQFVVEKSGEKYLVINSPTDVKTCGGINICDEIEKGKQSLTIDNSGQLSISNGNTVQLPIQSISLSSSGELSISGGNSIQLPDPSPTNEIQSLSIDGGTISLSTGGGRITLPDSSSTNEIQSLTFSGGTISLSNGGGSIILPDSSTTNEIQSLSITGGTVSLSNNGGSIILPDSSATNEIQSLSINGGTISLTNGGSITLPDQSPTNEIQSLSITAGTISLSNGGGSVALPDTSSTNEIQSLSISAGTVSLSNGGGSISLLPYITRAVFVNVPSGLNLGTPGWSMLSTITITPPAAGNIYVRFSGSLSFSRTTSNGFSIFILNTATITTASTKSYVQEVVAGVGYQAAVAERVFSVTAPNVAVTFYLFGQCIYQTATVDISTLSATFYPA